MGHGKCTLCPNSIGDSGGKYEDATIQDHYKDLVDVIAWAKTQNWYREKFVLAGHSLGGYAVARYAEDHPEKVKAVFPYALVVSGELNWKASQQFNPKEFESWKQTGWTTRTSRSKPEAVMRLPWSHMLERLKHDLMPNASKITMPILFIVGEKDESCPPDQQKILYDLVPEPKELHIISNAPHTFREPEHLGALRNILGDWIEKLR